MARTKGEGGGKVKNPLTYKPNEEGLERFDTLISEKVKQTPVFASLSKSVWVAELMGFTEQGLVQAADRLYLAGHVLTGAEKEQINALGEIISLWPKMNPADQKMFAVRIETLLSDVRMSTGMKGGSQKPSSKVTKQTRSHTSKQEIKTKSA